MRRVIRFGKDEKGEFHEGYPIIRVQKNGLLEVLCPFGHIIDYDVHPEFIHYYNKPIKCYGKI